MQATLVVVEPNLTPSEYTVELPATIGRGREAKLKFSHALLSRRHCELLEDDGGIVVRDLGSRNGTFIGGNRVETAPLAPGELLTVGGITLRAIYGADADVALAPQNARLGDLRAADETIPMDDTMTVAARPADKPSSPVELKADELDWLDDPAPPSTPQSQAQQSPRTDDDDFDKFLEGMR